jgi:4-amino-4-deoxy-L-arabinose transferase-like glycosyltransferase
LSQHSPIALLLFFIFIAFFLPLPLAPLFDLDEGAFSEATREMLVGKDYITTYLNGELRFDKPILIYWLQLLSVKLFGLNEFALRLPSAIAGALWAGTIYWFVKRTINAQTAFFATLFMIVALQINMIAKAAIADALLNLWIAISMFTLYLYYKEQKRQWLYIAFLTISLGVLTKGPVAIMIPLIVTFLFFVLEKRVIQWLKMVFNPVGIVIFMVVALPWYIAEYMAQGQAFIDGFFLKHNVSRFSAAMETHSGTLFYFIPVLLVGVMPFTYFAIKAIIHLKSYLHDPLKRYLFLWFAFVFLFFSLSGTKLPHYVIYGYTPLFILAGLYVEKPISKGWLLYPMLLLSTLLLFLPELATLFQTDIHNALALVLIETIYDAFNLTYQLLLLALIAFLLFLLFSTLQKEKVLLGVALSMVLLVNYIVIPTYGKLMQQPIKEAARLAKQEGYQDIIMHKVNTPSFNVYYEGLVRKTTPKSGDIVFTQVPKLKEFKAYKTLYRHHGFALIKVGE